MAAMSEAGDKMKVVQVEARVVYGVLKIYPMNDIAELACKIAGTKTLSKGDLDTLELMGFKIEEVLTKKVMMAA